ncbi:TetR/AcrR family transcriptional regulator [Spirillospora sp. CA-142024]|uniref:TetR/AcrR family transcriptional regulator n=1 Tax=Spirillospora sp. CA-142024 TaxID=3240036 RepID=UPI003D89DA0D
MAERGTAGRPADATADTEEARVRSAAARLFAELGYDATSNRMIADAAGVDPGTVPDRYGGKQGLYMRVNELTAERWRNRMASLRETFTPDGSGLAQFADMYLDYSLENPEVPKLLTHRWMSDASDVTRLDDEIVGPLLQETIGLVRSALGPEVDAEATLWTIVWTVHGYLQAGYLDATGRRSPPSDPGALRRFRRYQHWLIQRMTSSSA